MWHTTITTLYVEQKDLIRSKAGRYYSVKHIKEYVISYCSAFLLRKICFLYLCKNNVVLAFGDNVPCTNEFIALCAHN